MEFPENGHLAELTKSLKSSSAAVPSLLYTLIVTPISLFASFYSPPPMQYAFALIAAFPVVITGFQISFFSIADKDRLQNEEHVEKKMMISRMTPQIGDAHSTIEIQDDQELIENPAAGEKDV